MIDLGATKHPDQPGTSFRVFLDPAGHPFCLSELIRTGALGVAFALIGYFRLAARPAGRSGAVGAATV